METLRCERLGITSQRRRSACPAVKALVVITVNRVQDVYSAPVYSTQAPSLGALDSLVVNDAAAGLDAAVYAKTSHDSAHVGDWFPTSRTNQAKAARLRAHRREERGSDDRRCGEIGTGRGGHSRGGRGRRIDDHSTDGTRAAVAAIDDARVRVLESSGHGLAEALNFGLQRCSCDIVARLDADDVFAARPFSEARGEVCGARRTGRGAGGGAVSWWTDGARAAATLAHRPILNGHSFSVAALHIRPGTVRSESRPR